MPMVIVLETGNGKEKDTRVVTVKREEILNGRGNGKKSKTGATGQRIEDMLENKNTIFRGIATTMASHTLQGTRIDTSITHMVNISKKKGVAANNMSGGRTAHSRFKIPLNLDNNLVCNIKKQSETTQLLRSAKRIIWDETSMAKRQAIKVVVD